MRFALKVLCCISLALAFAISGHAQERPADLRPAAEIFKNFSGYLDEEDHKYHLEGEGYNIVITTYDRTPNASTFEHMVHEMPNRKRVLQNKLNGKPLENYVLDATVKKSDPPVIARNYLVAGKDSTTVLDIGIARYTGFNEHFVGEVISSIFYDGIYQPMLVSTKSDVVDFAGRKMKFTGDCFWLKPHVIKCSRTGIITWYLFNSLAEAEAYKQLEMDLTRRDIGKKMQQDTARVPVYFEGVPTVANNFRFESDEFSLVFRDNRFVNAYYIAARVRDRFVYCRLIFSDVASRDADPDSGLPALIARFIRFR